MTTVTATGQCAGTTYQERIDPWRLGALSLWRCETCERVFRTKRRHPAPGPTTRSHDRTMQILWAYAREPDDVVRPWTIVFDVDGDPHTRCPRCASRDSISEVDRAVRWNSLDLAEDGKSAVASTGSADFEGEGWICTSCLNDNLEAPDDFEITDWS